jgi:hypothetical protein
MIIELFLIVFIIKKNYSVSNSKSMKKEKAVIMRNLMFYWSRMVVMGDW